MATLTERLDALNASLDKIAVEAAANIRAMAALRAALESSGAITPEIEALLARAEATVARIDAMTPDVEPPAPGPIPVPEPPPPAPSAFRWFDGTAYRGKPGEIATPTTYELGVIPGCERMDLVYEQQFYPNRKPAERVLNGPEPLAEDIERVADQVVAKGLARIVIDIELWQTWAFKPLGPEHDAAVEKYARVLRIFKARAPSVQVGYYAIIPAGVYYPYTQPKASAAIIKQVEEIPAANAAMQPIADLVDFVCPSIYGKEAKADVLTRLAEGLIGTARMFGKPVYAFAWPQHSTGVEFASNPPMFTGELWAHLLAEIRRLADGVIIWGGQNVYGNMTPFNPATPLGQMPWNPAEPWAVETMRANGAA